MNERLLKFENMNNDPINIERVFNAPISKVWKAITERDEMAKWYFDLAEFKPETGFQFRFSGGPSPERQYLHLCEITEVIDKRKLSYTWRYDGYRGNTLVTFELLEHEDNFTLLKLTHVGIETFPEENPDFAKSNFVEGWNEIIHVSLKKHLETSDFQF